MRLQMKKILLSTLGLICAMSLAAQRAPYETGTTLVHAGLGFFSTIYTTSHSPSYNIGFERGITKIGPGTIGIGAVGNFQTSSFNYYNISSTTDYLNYDMKSYTFDVRGTYHPSFFPSKIIDVYGGFALGFNIINKNVTPIGFPTNTNIDLGPKSDLHFALLAGFRVYIKPKIGLFGEAGYDISPIKLGLVAKF
jgi:Outer membrane protein beta-barrel domain